MKTRFPSFGQAAFLAAVAGILLWHAGTLVAYARLLADLAGEPRLERGRIAADESRNFQVRIGRPRMREALALARGRGDREVSRGAEGWAWVATAESLLPLDARIYLNVPDRILYYYGNFFWYPRRLDANPAPVLIKDDQTLAAHALHFGPDDLDSLRRMGYTHVVVSTSDGARLIHLAAPSSGTKP